MTILMAQMWWGLLFGVVAVGFIGRMPREALLALLGQPGTMKGIFRATLAGVVLDVCNHGILMIGTKLYQKGASMGQLMAFLIASPWNSLSLTFVLIAMIGLKWTLSLIIISAVIAFITGMIFDALVRKGTLPPHPDLTEPPIQISVREALRMLLPRRAPTPKAMLDMLVEGFKESRSVMRWVLLGAILAVLLRTFMPIDMFAHYFGPSLLGIMITLLAATVMEICSEGSAPIAADILNRAAAPGNAFAFLMAGVSTDYTEIMAIREATKSWKAALFLPLITVPQILIVAWVMNGL
ncbi:MAG: permease [Rickettsiales bacterium]